MHFAENSTVSTTSLIACDHRVSFQCRNRLVVARLIRVALWLISTMGTVLSYLMNISNILEGDDEFVLWRICDGDKISWIVGQSEEMP